MKDKKTYNMELQTGEKTSHKAVSPYWFAFIPAAAFAILTMYVGISENMASGAILFVSVVIVFLMIFVPISLIIFMSFRCLFYDGKGNVFFRKYQTFLSFSFSGY